MAKQFLIEYSPETIEHLRALKATQRALVLDQIDEQLRYQPNVETKNRKRMRPNLLAPWELRMGDLRAYYDVETEPEPRVLVRAIGLKVGSRVWIGGEEFAV